MSENTFSSKLTLFNYTPSHKLTDVVHLLLCMFVSHQLLSNLLFGAALYVASTFWVVFIRTYSRRSPADFHWMGSVFFAFLFLLALGLNIALFFIYPAVTRLPGCGALCIFVLLLCIRTVLTDYVCICIRGSWRQRLRTMGFIHLLCLAALFAVCRFCLSGGAYWAAALTLLATGAALLWKQAHHPHIRRQEETAPRPALHGVSSFRIFSNTALYHGIALYLGMFIYIFYMFSLTADRGIGAFLLSALWILLVSCASFGFYRFLLRTGRAARLGCFAAGAILWAAATLMLFDASAAASRAVWSVLWGCGLALTHACLTSLARDLKLLSPLIDEEITPDALMSHTIVLQDLALAVAGILMLVVLTVWNFYIPSTSAEISRYFSGGVSLLPMAIMLISLGFSLQQTLDPHNRDRLKKLGTEQENPDLKKQLSRLLVAKYRRRWGVKVIMAVLRPIYHHKVLGQENIAQDDNPSIFVCNHGEIYGPITAVLYLPVYFRPWIDNRMLDKEKIVPHMYQGTFSRLRFLPKSWRMGLTRLAAGAVRWALSSFDPIPVSRDDLRAIAKTFDESVAAMRAGDNILLFPEDPSATENGRYADGDVGAFFTGFAHIGASYYKKTDQCTRFYPVYADKHHRTLTIGSPIRFDPSRPAREEKLRIAAKLQAAMGAMAQPEE
ncbi:MAG: hypothetical protein IJP03_06010 [Christensenellaceae bacterium]|nr:hypothetical protein [Christensenellaceae bacterium]